MRRSVAISLAFGVLAMGLVAWAPRPDLPSLPSLPAGFRMVESPSGQAPYDLTAVSYLPDGGALTTGKSGNLSWVATDGRTRSIAQLSVDNTADYGLVGLAVAADYTTSGHVYTARALERPDESRWEGVLRLSEWTVEGGVEPTGLVDERVILETSSEFPVHGMTGLIAAVDGTLWVSTGDAVGFGDSRRFRALDVDEPFGKLLHIRPDGRGVAGNPFFDPADPTAWRSRVYASGFRSPFRISLDPATGMPIVADVGQETTEEINLVSPGASYGWPCWEGTERFVDYADDPRCAGFENTEPTWSYPRAVGSSVTGGFVYTGDAYPAAYQGAYFFGDYAAKDLFTLTFDAAGNLTRAPEPGGFGADVGASVRIVAGPKGDVVFADLETGTLKRLTYVPGNRPPTARATATTIDPDTGTISFDAAGSSDLDGDRLSYEWGFGDGGGASGATATHSYGPSQDPVTARFTVTDALGAEGTAELTVVPSNRAPVIDLQAPGPEVTHAIGDQVEATATATDAEDGPVPIQWRTTLVHCRSEVCHDHPGETIDGGAYSVTFEDHGDDTRLEVTATAMDSAGVVSSERFVAVPRLRRLTVTSNRPVATTINAQPATTELVIAGSTNTITTAATSADGGHPFERWRDGGPRNRTLVMPDADLTLEAVYATPRVNFVRAAYEDFLDREPSSAELSGSMAYLNSGGSRQGVVTLLARSPEWVATIVDRFYIDTLGRPADEAGRAYWVDELASGRRSVAQVGAQFYASNEYFSGIGGATLRTWVEDLYRKLLNREADTEGRNYWVSQALGHARAAVSMPFFQSGESRRLRVSRLYEDLLGRSADAGGQRYWSDRIRREGDIVLAINLASSPEYRARATQRF